MKSYIQRVIELFSASSFSRYTTFLVQKWLVGEKTAADADAKEEALRTLWDHTDASMSSSETAQALRLVYQKAGFVRKDSVWMNIRLWYRYAAVIALLFASVLVTYYLTGTENPDTVMKEHFTAAGTLGTLVLPDGTTVQTNSETILLYPECFGEVRHVYLIGEADFKVCKDPDKPFVVHASGLSVTALGTEFNISSYPDQEHVVATLIKGSVQVECDNHSSDTYVLNPGEQVVHSRQTRLSVLQSADLTDVTAWQKGQLVFRGATMVEILRTLERRFGVKFQYASDCFNDDRYNFHFRTQSRLDMILDVIQVVVGGFDYRIEGNVCYLTHVTD